MESSGVMTPRMLEEWSPGRLERGEEQKNGILRGDDAWSVSRMESQEIRSPRGAVEWNSKR